MDLPVPGTEPTSSVDLGECVTHQATVADWSGVLFTSPEDEEKKISYRY